MKPSRLQDGHVLAPRTEGADILAVNADAVLSHLPFSLGTMKQTAPNGCLCRLAPEYVQDFLGGGGKESLDIRFCVNRLESPQFFKRFLENIVGSVFSVFVFVHAST
jgi:hypothetical protein